MLPPVRRLLSSGWSLSCRCFIIGKKENNINNDNNALSLFSISPCLPVLSFSQVFGVKFSEVEIRRTSEVTKARYATLRYATLLT